MPILAFTVLILLTLALYLSRRYIKSRIAASRAELASSCIDISGMTYQESQITNLPEPVQRYFRYTLEDGCPYISSVYLKHDGQFKTRLDREWVNIEGEQHFTADPPGFVWAGKTTLFSMSDAFVGGRGRDTTSFLGILTTNVGEGPEYDRGELLRWLGENIWFPTNLLPSNRLSWSGVDSNTAEFSFCYEGQHISCIVSFNSAGEIVQLKTRRQIGTHGPCTWIGRISRYKWTGGMRIPMKTEAFWELEDGEHCYARFNVKEIHYR